MTGVAKPIGAGAILPRMSFPQVDAAGMVSWNQGTTASVVFAPHIGPCTGCAQYLEELASAAPGLREWGARALVLSGPRTALAGMPAPDVHLLDDAASAGRAALGVGDNEAGVVQADRWGAIYQAEFIVRADAHSDLPTWRELVGLAQLIDIQCPECGVPSKEWLSATAFPLG